MDSIAVQRMQKNSVAEQADNGKPGFSGVRQPLAKGFKRASRQYWIRASDSSVLRKGANRPSGVSQQRSKPARGQQLMLKRLA